jgi:hypothetical protein
MEIAVRKELGHILLLGCQHIDAEHGVAAENGVRIG